MSKYDFGGLEKHPANMEGYAHPYDGGTKDMNLEALREIRRAHGTLVD